MGEYSFGAEEPYEVLATAYALPTACLSFDLGKGSYGPATAAAASASGSAKSHEGGKSGGAGAGAVNPFGGRGVGVMGVMVAVSGLVFVGSVCFVVL